MVKVVQYFCGGLLECWLRNREDLGSISESVDITDSCYIKIMEDKEDESRQKKVGHI